MQEGTAARGKLAPARNAGQQTPPGKPLDKPAEVEYIPVVAGTRLARLLRTLAQHGDLERDTFRLTVYVKGSSIHASIEYDLI